MKAIVYTKYGSPDVLELKGIKPQVGRGGFGGAAPAIRSPPGIAIPGPMPQSPEELNR